MPRPLRVLCSLAELRAHRGRALKFELVLGRSPGRRRRETGLVFWCDASERPRAFVNRCPHARLELDLDDSDFFSAGFLQCKAHGAFFDPRTGMCLQGPTGVRASPHPRAFPGLSVLEVRVDDDENVVLLLEDESQARVAAAEAAGGGSEAQSAYRRERQRELAAALASQADDVRAMETTLQEKAAGRIQRYREQQHQLRVAEAAARKADE